MNAAAYSALAHSNERVAESHFVVDNLPAPQRSMRVAMVTETYPPEVNGVALSVARLVQGLRARNHAVQLIRPRQKAVDPPSDMTSSDEVLLAGLPVPRYPHLRMGMPCTAALVTLWSRQRPDVVHIATEGPLGWSAVRAAARLKLPSVSDFRTNFHSYSQHYGVGWLRKPIAAYLRKFHNRTLRTLVPTPALRRELHSLGFCNLTVLPRGVDTQRFDPAWRSDALRRSWGAGEQTVVMLCVSRLAPEKNLEMVCRAFEMLQQAHINTRLVLVGDGPLRRELSARCPQAVIAGMRHGADLSAHYASADLFVFPSLTETFGNVTTEALASGLPVVAFNHAAAGELIHHGVHGLLAPVDQPQMLLQLALQAAGAPALRRQLGHHARQLALTLAWERIVSDFENILDEATQSVAFQGRAQAPQAGMSMD